MSASKVLSLVFISFFALTGGQSKETKKQRKPLGLVENGHLICLLQSTINEYRIL